MNDFLWTLDRISLRGNGRPRLDDVSLQIAQGTTAILGISGAGKTSLISVLCGFIAPDSGRIERTLPARNGRLPLFWVPQNDGLWPHRTVVDHVKLVQPSDSAASPTAQEWLAAFDLDHRSSVKPEHLSHGERNRLAVVRALASGAAVLLMDEPLAHVDPARRAAYWNVIRRHCQETETSLIFVTHSSETVLSEAERAICLREGRITEAGPVEDLYRSPRTFETACLFGPANWLSSAESQQWLGIVTPKDRCFRPEDLAIARVDDGPYRVQEARFAGSVGEVALNDERTGESRRFFHRPSGSRLAVGDRVVIKMIGALLLCLIASACAEKTAPLLPVREIHYWAMPPKGAKIPAPRSVTWGPAQEVYVLDKAGRVVVFDESGKLLRQWNMPDSRIGNPEGACVFADGRVAVADTHYSRVVFFDQAGKVLGMMGSEGKAPGQFYYPICITQDPHGDFYVGEYGGNDRVQKFAVDGKFLLQIGQSGTGPGQFQRASGVAWYDGKLYVADAINNRLQIFSDKGQFQSMIGLPESGVRLEHPYDLAVGPDKDLFVIEYLAARVSRFDLASGRLIGRFGERGRGEGQFTTPWGIAVNSKGTILVADTDNRRIVELLR